MITILDYGMGNLRSVQKAFEFLGETVRIQNNLTGAERLVIPGVGAFGAAMDRIEPLKKEIRSFASSGQPVLGICLGQQLLFDRSEEHGEHVGLELIPGDVKYFSPELGLKVPHIGWSPLTWSDGPMKTDLTDGDSVYFVHSLYTETADEGDIQATAQYGIPFAAAVRRGNVWGCQFHPEKSSSVGLQILKNWVNQ